MKRQIPMNRFSLSARRDEQGLVSMIVVMVLMIVISLIVLGFAQISRRNQRVTLDQQLNTQAFYAAESGVNDAAKLIANAEATGQKVYAKPTCAAPSDPSAAAFYSGLPSSTLDAANNVSYSCLMVNPDVSSNNYNNIGTTSTIIPLNAEGGVNFGSVTFTWQTNDRANKTPLNGCPTSTNRVFTPTWPSTCGYGVFRFDLVPTAGGNLDMPTLENATMTGFVIPVNGGAHTASVPYLANTANTNDVINGSCDNNACSLTITGLSVNQYFARVSSLYKDVSLQVSATDTTGKQINLTGAQISIDATGKAQDVLRRVQVRVSTTGQATGSSNSSSTPSLTQLPDYALQTTDSICKEFAVMSGGSGFYQNQVTGITSTNPMCN